MTTMTSKIKTATGTERRISKQTNSSKIYGTRRVSKTSRMSTGAPRRKASTSRTQRRPKIRFMRMTSMAKSSQWINMNSSFLGISLRDRRKANSIKSIAAKS